MCANNYIIREHYRLETYPGHSIPDTVVFEPRRLNGVAKEI
jgi:hypothetical protein